MKNFKKYGKRIFYMALAVQVAGILFLTGCAKTAKQAKIDETAAKNNVVMTIEDFEVTQQLYNLYTIQYMYNNKIQPLSLDETSIQNLQDIVVLELKSEMVQYLLAKTMNEIEITDEALAASEANAASMYDFFGEKFLTQYGIDKVCIKELFVQQAYISALRDKSIADLTETYKEQYEKDYQDMVFHTVYYALFPSIQYDKDGNPIQADDNSYSYLPEDEMKVNEEKASELMKRAKAGEEMEKLVEEYGIAAYSGIERDYDGAYSKELNDVISGLSEGDISDVVKTDAGYMIVRMDTKDDKQYKEYMINSLASQTANDQITTLQANWLKASGAENITANQSIMNELDIVELGKEMQKKGFY